MTRRNRRPHFNGSPDDHAATEQWPAQLRTDEIDGTTYQWAGASDIGVMTIATFARPAPLDGYQPQPPSFPALPAAPEPQPRDVLPPVPVTMPAVIGDDLKLPVIWCEMPGCISFYLDDESAGFRDARDHADAAGWRTDALGRLACPGCQQGRADYRTPQPVTWHHPGIPRRWHERGTLPSEETQTRLTGAAEYARYVSRKRPDWAAAMAGATHRTAAS